MAIVYLITNIENGKRYVGKTKHSLAKRWYNHVQEARRGRGFALHAAIRKYGSDAFNRKVLGEYPTEEEALIAERAWVLRLGTMGEGGYNLCEGGRGALGLVWTEERRELMQEVLNTPEAKAKMSEASKAAKAPPAVRAKISAEIKALWADPDVKAARSAAIAAGKKANPRTSRSLAEAGRKLSETMAKRRAERTHFDCSVHGEIPLSECYSKIRKSGIESYECKKCVLAAQKVLRDSFRAANPIILTTSYRCRVHGEVPPDGCYSKVDKKTGKIHHSCKVCTLANQKRGRDAQKTTFTPCPALQSLRQT